MALLACGGNTERPVASPPTTSQTPAAVAIPRMEIAAEDFAYDAPDTVQAGMTSIVMRNAGVEPHQALLFRLNEGVTLDQVAAAFVQSPQTAVALLSYAGGPGTVPTGGSQEVIQDLAAGQYLMVCPVPSPDGQQHLAKGMFRPFQVVPATAAQAPRTNEGQAPRDEGQVTMRDFSFKLPPVQTGEHTFKVVNEGPLPHEMLIVRLAPGKTLADAFSFVKSPGGVAPYEDAGGLLILTKDQSGWLRLNLSPGNYLAICLVLDQASGKTHAEMGMITPFMVR